MWHHVSRHQNRYLYKGQGKGTVPPLTTFVTHQAREVKRMVPLRTWGPESFITTCNQTQAVVIAINHRHEYNYIYIRDTLTILLCNFFIATSVTVTVYIYIMRWKIKGGLNTHSLSLTWRQNNHNCFSSARLSVIDGCPVDTREPSMATPGRRLFPFIILRLPVSGVRRPQLFLVHTSLMRRGVKRRLGIMKTILLFPCCYRGCGVAKKLHHLHG